MTVCSNRPYGCVSQRPEMSAICKQERLKNGVPFVVYSMDVWKKFTQWPEKELYMDWNLFKVNNAEHE